MEQHQDWRRETEHLAHVIGVAGEQLEQARRDSDREVRALVDARQEAGGENDYAFGNLWASDDFENLLTLSQAMHSITLKELQNQATVKRVATLAYMVGTPYFARIDLRFEGEDRPEEIYIGRATLWDEGNHSLLINDWRSPIASVFYRFGAGPASYQAPGGTIECEVTRKRQYEIKRGVLAYFFDADAVIEDAFLRRMLSQNASPRMKAIVETIQRDQDLAIRDEAHDLLMVQGVAGSGKTSIGLHRVAYLMYEGLKDRLREHNILILSPNTLFERYIAGVLPELGERAVASKTFERLLQEVIHAPVQSRIERLDALLAAEAGERARMRASLAAKASPAFVALLDRFSDEVAARHIEYSDLDYAGRTLMTRQQFKNRATHRTGVLPLGMWLMRFERAIFERVHALRPRRIEALRDRAMQVGRDDIWVRACSIFESAALAREVRRMTRLDARALYQKLMTDRRTFDRLSSGLPPLRDAWREPPAQGPLPLEDAAAIAYLHVKLDGAPSQGDIRQVVIDEAQDYGAIDYALMKGLFARARFTVLGDVSQAMERPSDMALYEDIARMIAPRSASLIELNKSFRCTREILTFAGQWLRDERIQSFNRSGDAPVMRASRFIADEVALCRAWGYRSIALIAKTEQGARGWADRLGIRLMEAGSGGAMPDAFVVPLALSKGLEFDAVLLLDADAAHYAEPDDARLLYVACTRALHRLTLFCDGEMSPLIKEVQHA